MGKTIARSSKKQIAAIVARVTGIKMYTLDNKFSGEVVEMERLQAIVADWQAMHGAQLTLNGDHAIIHFHFRHWVRLVLAEVAQ